MGKTAHDFFPKGMPDEMECKSCHGFGEIGPVGDRENCDHCNGYGYLKCLECDRWVREKGDDLCAAHNRKVFLEAAGQNLDWALDRLVRAGSENQALQTEPVFVALSEVITSVSQVLKVLEATDGDVPEMQPGSASKRPV